MNIDLSTQYLGLQLEKSAGGFGRPVDGQP